MEQDATYIIGYKVTALANIAKIMTTVSNFVHAFNFLFVFF